MNRENVNSGLKSPGMRSIARSFMPWCFYWMLQGFGNNIGIIIPFVISLFIILPQIQKNYYNLMDVTAILYFSIVITSTFLLDFEIFVEKSGFISYFALFIMALFSLLIRKPFTYQVSKKDYPKTNPFLNVFFFILFIHNYLAYFIWN